VISTLVCFILIELLAFGMIGTFYSHYVGFDKIVGVFRDIYPKAVLNVREDNDHKYLELVLKGGFFVSDKKVMVSYREKANLSFEPSGDEDDALAVNLNGLFNYVSSLPSENMQVKSLLLSKIRTVNCEFSLWQEGGEVKGIRPLMERLALDFDAVVFAQPGSVISQADGQHFLDRNLKLVLDTSGRSQVDNLEVNIESKYFDADQNGVSGEQLALKRKNEAFLLEKQINVNEHLPCIESEAEITIRPAEEIARRVCVLAVTNFVAFDVLPSASAVGYLKEHQLGQFASPN
jgi:hypothetical protein